MSQRKSRRDFIQKPYFKKSHNAMYVDIDGKPRRLCSGDKLTPEGGELYQKALAERGKKPAAEVEEIHEPTIADLVEDFLLSVQANVRKGNLAPRTYDWYFEHLNSFANRYKHLTIGQLMPFHVQEWLDEHYATSGVNHQNGGVRAVARVFNWARKLGKISKNPIEAFERPSPKPRKCWLKDWQWEMIAAKLKGDDFADIVHFLALTGCRPHEARTAKVWHFQDESLVFEEEESKGKKRQRVILLHGEALEIVQRRLSGSYIFTNAIGNPWTSYALNCRFARLREDLAEELPEGKRFRVYPGIFRHTWITNALRKGLNPITVAALAGHVNAVMIMKVYSHVCQDNEHLREQNRRATG